MDIEALHRELLDAWNARDASRWAALFTEDASQVGFDGSTVEGRDAIVSHLAGIFADHETAAYVPIVREVRSLGDGTALLRADVGMVPPGQDDINEGANAVQSLVAVRDGDTWRIAHFQNTPAAFHGRPEAARALTDELRGALHPARR